MTRPRSVWGAALAAVLLTGALWAAEAPKQKYRHIAFDTPLEVAAKPGEEITKAVREFHATGKNPYGGDPKAAAEGKKLYDEWCASCHMPLGTGGMGPSLVGAKHIYPRTETDVGLFETIYGGALGAMQPFGDRLTQDEMLKLIAYINSLRKNARR